MRKGLKKQQTNENVGKIFKSYSGTEFIILSFHDTHYTIKNLDNGFVHNVTKENTESMLK